MPCARQRRRRRGCSTRGQPASQQTSATVTPCGGRADRPDRPRGDVGLGRRAAGLHDVASPAHGGVSRISWVYTPPALRGNGYASACVYGASVQQVARGHRCMLYTDLANSTSNAIYQAVGYRRHGDSVLLAFEGSAAAVVR
ncbi:MAG: GNAT family N-acetyltransferase [Nocardioidaceae bacterium]